VVKVDVPVDVTVELVDIGALLLVVVAAAELEVGAEEDVDWVADGVQLERENGVAASTIQLSLVSSDSHSED